MARGWEVAAGTLAAWTMTHVAGEWGLERRPVTVPRPPAPRNRTRMRPPLQDAVRAPCGAGLPFHYIIIGVRGSPVIQDLTGTEAVQGPRQPGPAPDDARCCCLLHCRSRHTSGAHREHRMRDPPQEPRQWAGQPHRGPQARPRARPFAAPSFHQAGWPWAPLGGGRGAWRRAWTCAAGRLPRSRWPRGVAGQEPAWRRDAAHAQTLAPRRHHRRQGASYGHCPLLSSQRDEETHTFLCLLTGPSRATGPTPSATGAIR